MNSKSIGGATLAVGLAIAGCSSGSSSPADGGGSQNEGGAGGIDSGTSAAEAGADTGTGVALDSGSTAPEEGGTVADSGAAGDTGAAATDGATGACSDSADQTLAAISTTPTAIANCAQSNIGREPATLNCIEGLGFSVPCSTCFDADAQCTIANCLVDCSGAPTSMACTMCQAMHCNTAFTACSGLTPQG